MQARASLARSNSLTSTMHDANSISSDSNSNSTILEQTHTNAQRHHGNMDIDRYGCSRTHPRTHARTDGRTDVRGCIQLAPWYPVLGARHHDRCPPDATTWRVMPSSTRRRPHHWRLPRGLACGATCQSEPGGRECARRALATTLGAWCSRRAARRCPSRDSRGSPSCEIAIVQRIGDSAAA